MAAPSPVSPTMNAPSKVIVVGGIPGYVYGTIQSRLEGVGVEIVGHWEEAKDEAKIPKDTAILCLVDLCSHDTSQRVAKLADKAGVLFLRGGRKWAFLRGVLTMHGMVRKPIEREQPTVEGVLSSILDRTPLAVSIANGGKAEADFGASYGAKGTAGAWSAPASSAPADSGEKEAYVVVMSEAVVVPVQIRNASINGNGKGRSVLDFHFPIGAHPKSRGFSLGCPTSEDVRLSKIGLDAIKSGKPSAGGITLASIFDLAATTTDTQEEVRVRQELLVETLSDIGRKEARAEVEVQAPQPALKSPPAARSLVVKAASPSPLQPGDVITDATSGATLTIPTPDPLDNQILDLLDALGGGVKVTVLMERLKRKNEDVYRGLLRLQKRDLVSCRGRTSGMRWFRTMVSAAQPPRVDPAAIAGMSPLDLPILDLALFSRTPRLRNRGDTGGKIRAAVEWQFKGSKQGRSVRLLPLTEAEYALARLGLAAVMAGTSAAGGLDWKGLMEILDHARPEECTNKLLGMGRRVQALPPQVVEVTSAVPQPVEWVEPSVSTSPVAPVVAPVVEPDPVPVPPPSPEVPMIPVAGYLPDLPQAVQTPALPVAPTPPPTDAEIRWLLDRLQTLLVQRPDILEMTVRASGPIRVKQQVVVDNDWV